MLEADNLVQPSPSQASGAESATSPSRIETTSIPTNLPLAVHQVEFVTPEAVSDAVMRESESGLISSPQIRDDTASESAIDKPLRGMSQVEASKEGDLLEKQQSVLNESCKPPDAVAEAQKHIKTINFETPKAPSSEVQPTSNIDSLATSQAGETGNARPAEYEH